MQTSEKTPVSFPREAFRGYQLAVAFHGHLMRLVPQAERGNAARTLLERATMRAMISIGEALDGPRTKTRGLLDQAVLAVDRAMIVIDGLRACDRVNEAEHANCRSRALEIRDEIACLIGDLEADRVPARRVPTPAIEVPPAPVEPTPVEIATAVNAPVNDASDPRLREGPTEVAALPLVTTRPRAGNGSTVAPPGRVLPIPATRGSSRGRRRGTRS